MVQLYHPALDRYIEVPANAAWVYERSGWQWADEAAPDEAEAEAAADVGADELEES